MSCNVTTTLVLSDGRTVCRLTRFPIGPSAYVFFINGHTKLKIWGGKVCPRISLKLLSSAARLSRLRKRLLVLTRSKRKSTVSSEGQATTRN